MSGVPQGSVLGPLLFLIFINDLDDSVTMIDIIKKFADDTKVGQVMVNEEDRLKLQSALDALSDWAVTWRTFFNVKKCKIMHLGNKNPEHLFNMGGETLGSTEEEKDIGVTVTSNLKPTAQCARAVRTAQGVLGKLSTAFHYRDRHVFVRLYQQYVRPHCSSACWPGQWSPWTEAYKSVLEKMQRRAVGMVSGLKELGLQSLEERRHQADKCMIHKILRTEDGLDSGTWFLPAGASGHGTRTAADDTIVKVKSGKLELRRNFFSVRASGQLNSIPSHIKHAKSAKRFKSVYRSHRDKMVVT